MNAPIVSFNHVGKTFEVDVFNCPHPIFSAPKFCRQYFYRSGLTR